MQRACEHADHRHPIDVYLIGDSMPILTESRKPELGFTLIELLVVIAIIAVLISVLLPSLSHARGQAIQVRCSVQMRELHTALIYYANDHRGKTPPSRDTRCQNAASVVGPCTDWDCDPWGDWWWGISGLWPYIKVNAVFQCPADAYSRTNPRVMGRIGPPACTGKTTGLDNWREGYSFGSNMWGLRDGNRYLRLDEKPQHVIWLYGHSGGFVHPVVSGAAHTDYRAMASNLRVQGEEVPYYTPGPMSYITKRHLGSFNTIALSGASQAFKWGTSEQSDWVN